MVFLSVCIVIDSILFYKGYNTYLWSYKTDLEKRIQLDKFGFEKATVNSNIDEKDIDMVAKNIAERYVDETKNLSKDGQYFNDLINIIKEELKSPNIPKN